MHLIDDSSRAACGQGSGHYLNRTVLLIFLVLLGFLSCEGRRPTKIKRDDLFTIPLGTLLGELDWFYRDDYRIAGSADIQTRDGLVYIVGGHTGKVMVFNSYGDLLTVVYDPQRNPAPVKPETEGSHRTIRSWSFRDSRFIAPFQEGFLVENGVEPQRRVRDQDLGAFCDRIILFFNRKGDYQNHLGREGFGGSPFPYIQSLDVREDDSVVVTCRVPDSWVSYWFDSSGEHLITVKIREDQLPGWSPGARVVLYSMRPDPVQWTMHLRVDVYTDAADASQPQARLYTFDLNTLVYSEPLSIPYTEDGNEMIPVPLNYLGTTVNGNHVFFAPEGMETYRVMLMNEDGKVIHHYRFNLGFEAGVYRRFRLHNDGLLAALLVGVDEAIVSWWRIDRLVDHDS